MSENSRAGEKAGIFRAVSRNLSWLLASRGVLAILSLVYLGIAMRVLGIADFGRFALITGAAQALAALVGFQTWQVVVRYGVDHLARGDRGALARLYRFCVILDAFSALIGLGAAAMILLFFGETMGIGPALLRDTILFTVVQLGTIRSAPLGILRLSDRFAAGAAADSMTPLIRLLGAVLAMLLAPDVRGFLWAWAAAEIATAGTYWWLVARSGDLTAIARCRAPTATIAAENPHLVSFLLSTNVGATLSLATKQLPLLLVGGYLGAAAAGGFRVALQLAQALGKFAQLLARAAFPEIVRQVRTEPAAALGRPLLRVSAVLGGAGMLILLVIVVGGEWLLVTLGGDPRFGLAYPSLVLLAGAGAIDLATVGFEPVLLAVHRATAAMLSRALGVGVQIGVMLLAMHYWATTGASFGVLVGSLVSALLLGACVPWFRAPEAPPADVGSRPAG